MKIKAIVTAGLIATALLTSQKAQAQSIRAGLQVAPSLPMGDIADLGVGFGIGGKLFGNYFLSDNIHIGMEVGFISYAGDDISSGGLTIETANSTVIPLQITGAYHLMGFEEDFNVYVGTGAGLFIQSSEGSDESTSQFGISPRVGVTLPLSDNLFINSSIDYSIIMGDEEITSTNFTTGEVTTVSQDIYDPTFLTFNLGISLLLAD